MLIFMTENSSRKRQPDITQQRLLDVAGELVTESGVMALTLEAVAKRAGVSKGGLLHHFPTKDALLIAVLEPRGRQAVERFFPEGLSGLSRGGGGGCWPSSNHAKHPDQELRPPPPTQSSQPRCELSAAPVSLYSWGN